MIIVMQLCLVSAQGEEEIGSENLDRLRSVARIDFPADLEIGWFEAKDDASAFIVFDADGRVYRVDRSGIVDSWSYREDEAQLFYLIDAIFLDDDPLILYLLDRDYFVNAQELDSVPIPVAIFSLENLIVVEAIDDGGATVFQGFEFDAEAQALQLLQKSNLPDTGSTDPAVRIGRVDLPTVVVSNLVKSAVTAYRYPDAFSVESGREYELEGGPAVYGAVNAAGSHLAWSDPASARLNRLELTSGENKVVADLDGAYAQFYLLSNDASVIVIVNLDFAPIVVAWDVESGQRYELGAYRDCARIPDKVALSKDGSALIIGCDTGLDIWRIVSE